jgi:hypothetical protein
MGLDDSVAKNAPAGDATNHFADNTVPSSPFHQQLNHGTTLADWSRSQNASGSGSEPHPFAVDTLHSKPEMMDSLHSVPQWVEKPLNAQTLAGEFSAAYNNRGVNPNAFDNFNKDLAKTAEQLSNTQLRQLIADINEKLPDGQGLMLERHPHIGENGEAVGMLPQALAYHNSYERYTVHAVTQSPPEPGMPPTRVDPDKGPLWELSQGEIHSKPNESLLKSIERKWGSPRTSWEDPSDPGSAKKAPLFDPGEILRFADPPGWWRKFEPSRLDPEILRFGDPPGWRPTLRHPSLRFEDPPSVWRLGQELERKITIVD